MNEMLDFEKEEENSKNGVTAVYVLGGIVYIGVIVVATVLTWMFITGILQQDQYGLKILLTIGVIAIGLNAIAMPVALHFWAVEGKHRGAAIGFYVLDMVILAVNMAVSFSTLRGSPPVWVTQYEPYSVSMFIFALAAWGILLMLDPGQKAGLELKKASQKFRVDAIKSASSYLESQEGKAAIATAANNLIPALFDPDKIMKKPQTWNVNASETKLVEGANGSDPTKAV